MNIDLDILTEEVQLMKKKQEEIYDIVGKILNIISTPEEEDTAEVEKIATELKSSRNRTKK
jgi:hypothetical protein